jgi:hypothetical protein
MLPKLISPIGGQVFSMESPLSTTTNASRPKDRSLGAYKAWIMDQRFAQENPRLSFTEAEWAAAWKEYWEEGSNY